MKTPISFRLRKDVDADLIQAMANMEQKKIAELARNGLRLMLGIRTTKRVAVVEAPIETQPQPTTVEVQGNGVAKKFNGSGFVRQQAQR